MTTPKKIFRRLVRSPEWQAFKRQCNIDGNPAAELAEQLEHIDDDTLEAFIAFRNYQHELHVRLLAETAQQVGSKPSLAL